MTQNASEVFTMQLARAAGKQANRYLRARGLQKADRDDIVAAAMLWCWENRANYSLTTTLETWFMNAIRDAHKDMRRHALPTADESIDNMGGEDTTYNNVEAESSAKVLIDALTPADKEVALLTLKGFSRAEMIAKGVPEWTIRGAKDRIKQLRRLIPDDKVTRKVIARTAPAVGSDDVEYTSGIDMELQQLDFAPPAGQDCPPCWRCMWFEGFMPAGKRDTRLDIEDKEVREAVRNTEAHKIEIAQQVRNGG